MAILLVATFVSDGWPHLEQCWYGTSSKFLACCWLSISSAMRSAVTAVLLSYCKVFMYVLIKSLYVRLN